MEKRCCLCGKDVSMEYSYSVGSFVFCMNCGTGTTVYDLCQKDIGDINEPEIIEVDGYVMESGADEF